MKLEKARELEALLTELDVLIAVKDILSNYDSKVEVKVSSVHNHNRGTSSSVCLPVEGKVKDEIIASIDLANQKVREKIDNF